MQNFGWNPARFECVGVDPAGPDGGLAQQLMAGWGLQKCLLVNTYGSPACVLERGCHQKFIVESGAFQIMHVCLAHHKHAAGGLTQVMLVDAFGA